MVVIARYRDLPGAEVASATLEEAGIENFLADTDTINILWTYSTALGWIRLSVAAADERAAREALESPAVVEWPAEEAVSGDRCQVCGRGDLEIDSGARKTLALMLLTIVPLWLWRSRERCAACGKGQPLPIRLRPEVFIVFLVAAISAAAVTALVVLVVGNIVMGRGA